jgi:hypothetical protein
MATSIAFHSKSAKNLKAKVKSVSPIKQVDTQLYKKATIFWIGKKPNESFLQIGEELNIENRRLEQDISVLVHASAFVACNLKTYTFKDHLNALCFAVNYGVPTFWLDERVAPYQWHSLFSGVFVGSVTPGVFWKEVFNWIK